MKPFNINRSSLLLYFLTFAFILQTIHACVAEFDAYWQERAAKAEQNTLAAYTPDPTNVTNQINSEISAVLAGNDTRRSLKVKGGKKKKGGPCEATNPIDQCWRCNRDWAKNRQRLADCGLGFAQGTTGGKGGPIYVVTDNSDNDLVNPKPGTLRHAVIQKGPLWIIFARSMIIELQQELIMTSHKTIDARGAIVKIANGPGLTLQYIKNVIIHGLRIHDIVPGSGGIIRDSVDHFGFRSDSDGDGISIYGSSNIWIDHVSLSRCHDGMIDCIMGSTAITISNCHFTDHNKVMLLGASNSYKQDQYMQVTVAFNHFGRGLVQRMPRCRWGFVHVVNNDYTHWLKYAIGGSQGPTIISQGNRFIAPNDTNAKEVTKREYAGQNEWKNWVWTSEGDLMMNGAFFTPSGSAAAAKKFSSKEFIKFQPGTSVTRLARHSGSLDCFEGKPC